MSREVSENVDGQGKWTDTPRGPSYADAYYAAREVAQQYNVQIHFRMHSVARSGQWQGSACRVDAVAVAVRAAETASLVGCSDFGGNGGARTMPGAMIAALYALEDKLVDPASAWIPPMYPHS